MALVQELITLAGVHLRVAHARRMGAAALAALALGACTRSDDNARQPLPAAATPVKAAPAAAVVAATPAARPVQIPHDDARADAWMRAIYGDAYDPARKQALSTLQVFDYPKPYLMTLRSAAALPGGRFAIVVSGAVAPDDSVATGDEHDVARAYSAGRFSLYIVQAHNEGWTIVERHESVSGMEPNPALCSVEWFDLGAGKPGFAVSSTIQGEETALTVLEVFELANGVRQLAELKQGGNNDAECSIESEKCWSVEGIPRFDNHNGPHGYADLTLDFQGKRFRYSEDDDTGMTIEIPLSTIQQATRYRFDGEYYELVSGTLPAELL